MGPRGHQGFHLLSRQLYSSCPTPMWHQGLGLVGMRVLWLSKECAAKLNRDQSIQPQMLKDKRKITWVNKKQAAEPQEAWYAKERLDR